MRGNQLGGSGRSLGLALIRDCNNARAFFDTLLRYRGGTLAEFWRALKTLKSLQAERAAQEAAPAPAPAADLTAPRLAATREKQPDEPEYPAPRFRGA